MSGAQQGRWLCGLFDGFGGARLTREVYADKCPDGLSFGGDHERVTKTAYEAGNPHVSQQGDTHG